MNNAVTDGQHEVPLLWDISTVAALPDHMVSRVQSWVLHVRWCGDFKISEPRVPLI